VLALPCSKAALSEGMLGEGPCLGCNKCGFFEEGEKLVESSQGYGRLGGDVM
jgi:hypothetical protein